MPSISAEIFDDSNYDNMIAIRNGRWIFVAYLRVSFRDIVEIVTKTMKNPIIANISGKTSHRPQPLIITDLKASAAWVGGSTLESGLIREGSAFMGQNIPESRKVGRTMNGNIWTACI